MTQRDTQQSDGNSEEKTMRKTFTETFKYGKAMRDTMYRYAHRCDYKPYKLQAETHYDKETGLYVLTYWYVKRTKTEGR